MEKIFSWEADNLSGSHIVRFSDTLYFVSWGVISLVILIVNWHRYLISIYFYLGIYLFITLKPTI
jgi:hypothetical protein